MGIPGLRRTQEQVDALTEDVGAAIKAGTATLHNAAAAAVQIAQRAERITEHTDQVAADARIALRRATESLTVVSIVALAALLLATTAIVFTARDR